MRTRQPSRSLIRPHAATIAAAAMLLGLAVVGSIVVTQARIAPSAVPAQMAVTADKSKGSRHLSAASSARLNRSAAGPSWSELSSEHKNILTPLQARWSAMSELTKRRWLSLADGFEHLKPEDQETLHKRMIAWASLSAQQRNQARFNFFASKQLSAEDLQAKWDEYQALSAQEKSRLAAKAQPKIQGAATAMKPQNKRNLARIPAASTASSANPPKIPPLAPPPRTAPAPTPVTAPTTHSLATPIAPAAAKPLPVVVPSNATVIDLPPLQPGKVVTKPTTIEASAVRPEPAPIHPPQ